MTVGYVTAIRVEHREWLLFRLHTGYR